MTAALPNSTSANPEDALPRRFGKYTLLRRMATGGMAEIFLSLQRSVAGFEKLIVIKRILPAMNQDRGFIDMLLHEARVAATLSHPNIVQTIDVGQVDGTYFIALEHIHGEDLRSIVRQMKKKGVTEFPLEHALAIILGMCAGLSYAHERRDLDGTPLGIVHRDISPQNVLVGFAGDTKIVDFGVAKSGSQTAEQTKSGQLKGKVPYMSPEQLTQRAVDARTDVFAASIVLWEALTGERLFYDENVGGMMARVLNAPIARPSEKVPGIPEALDAIVMRGLSRDPEARFPTAKAMASALEELGPARAQQVGAWVEALAGTALRERASRLAEIERDSTAPPPLLSSPSPNDVPTQILKDPPPVEPVIVASSSAESPRRRSIALPLVAVLALLALLAGGAFAMTRRPEPTAPVAHEPPPPVPVASPSASVVAQVAPEPIASPAKSAPAPAVLPRKKLAPVATKPACDPPYFIDAEGVKRFKPGCL